MTVFSSRSLCNWVFILFAVAERYDSDAAQAWEHTEFNPVGFRSDTLSCLDGAVGGTRVNSTELDVIDGGIEGTIGREVVVV